MKPVVIAHRGASGYLPEHTLAAKALAHEMGADYLEQDVVATRDDELIVLHDIHLDRVTDVAQLYPDRARADGRYYARDFDLEEILGLRAWERVNARGEAVFPGRYPPGSGDFRLNTLREEITLIKDLNASTGREVGIYPEIKRPAWHKAQGVDIAPLLLDILSDSGYTAHEDPVFVQCFDDAELRRIRFDLGCPLKLVQLIGENAWLEASTDYVSLRSRSGLDELRKTVDGIGPLLTQLYSVSATDSAPTDNGMVGLAHEYGLVVHPYTFRADDLPSGFRRFEDLVTYFSSDIGVDGLFTDFPDQARRAIDASL